MRKLLPAVFSLLLIASAGLAGDEVGTAQIGVSPDRPRAGDSVTLLLSGTWPDSCVPHSSQMLRLGSFITINLSTPSEDCLPATTDWQMEVHLGELSAGSYMVNVSAEGDTIGQTPFVVGERPADDRDQWEVPTEPAVPCENPYFPPLVLLLSTVDEVPWGASLPVSLVVTTTAHSHAFLFTSGQRYDFAVYKDGEEVWRWSDEQAFIMAIGEETYTTDGVLYFERVDTTELPGPGTYTLQGTLTTEGWIEDEGVAEHGPAHVCVTFTVVDG